MPHRHFDFMSEGIAVKRGVEATLSCLAANDGGTGPAAEELESQHRIGTSAITRLHIIVCRAGLSILMLASVAAMASDSLSSEGVYVWFCDLSESTGILKIEVRLGDQLVDLSHVSYCKRAIANRPPEERRSIIFYFSGTGSVFSDKESIIVASIWQDNAERDGLTLRASFVSDGRIVASALHPVLLGEVHVSNPMEGLSVKTSTL